MQKVQTKRIDGTDGGTLQQHPLAAQRCIARLLLAQPQQRLPDACPQLCRRRIGKCNDQQLVGIHRVLRVGNELHRPLGQHSGLAAARCGADQQRTAPVRNGSTLGRGPFRAAHASSSSFFSGSKGFWVFPTPAPPHRSHGGRSGYNRTTGKGFGR